MNPARTLLYFFGIVLVIAAIAIFFFETGLQRWVPVSLLLAGILLIIGLSVMGFAEDAPAERRRYRDETDSGDVTVVKR